MRTLQRVSIVAGVVVGSMTLPRTAGAQMNQLFKPVFECKESGSESKAEALKRCVDAFVKKPVPPAQPEIAASRQQPPNPMRQDGRAKHLAMLDHYAKFLAAKKVVSAALTLKANDVDLTDAQLALDEDTESIHAELQAHGLEETSQIVGELRTGPVVTSTGVVGGSAAPDHSTGGDALAHIVWQTTHAGALDRLNGGDFSFEGQFGLQPALTLLQAQQSATATQLASQYQQALVVDVGINASHFSGSNEMSFVARGGFVRIGQLAQVVESNGAKYLATPIGSTDQTTPYVEFGLRASLYDRPMPVVHIAMGGLSPRLMGEAVFRRDSRFSQAADVLKISSPENRVALRFMLDGLNVLDKRTDGEQNKVFKVGIGFEYQRGWTDGAPSGFSFLIRGDADLLKILQAGHTDS